MAKPTPADIAFAEEMGWADWAILFGTVMLGGLTTSIPLGPVWLLPGLGGGALVQGLWKPEWGKYGKLGLLGYTAGLTAGSLNFAQRGFQMSIEQAWVDGGLGMSPARSTEMAMANLLRGSAIKAQIQTEHPDFTEEQVTAELKRRLEAGFVYPEIPEEKRTPTGEAVRGAIVPPVAPPVTPRAPPAVPRAPPAPVGGVTLVH